MKKTKPDEIDIEQIDIERAAKLLETAASAPLHTETRQRRRKRKQPKTEKSSIRDRIEKEINLYETEQDVRPFRRYILEPPPNLSWTKSLPNYEDARLSAENAMRKIFALTDSANIAFEAGHPESVRLDVFFGKVRIGWIQADSPKIVEMLQYAQVVGRTQSYLFIERLADELKNARKRVAGAPQFSEFRALLVTHWMHHGFWLMPDDLIARIATTRKMKPDGCNRQTITKAVKELQLVKHPDTAHRPIVKDFAKGDKLIFRDGYPPKS
jgi:hypothetical protein